MKHFRWMAALVAAALVLSACGSMQTTELPNEALTLAAVAYSTPITEENDEPSEWTQDPSWDCFFLEPSGPSDEGFWVYPPVVGDIEYVWTRLIVQRDGMHYVFDYPAVDSVVAAPDGGYDSVIGCKIEREPEPEPEWCSPGFWSNNPLAAGEAAAAGGFSLSDLYSASFGAISGINERQRVRLDLPLDPTLQQVLDHPMVYGGAAFNNVGDKLSGAHPDVNFMDERVEDSCPLSADASRKD
jgi:hypothetical protein